MVSGTHYTIALDIALLLRILFYDEVNVGYICLPGLQFKPSTRFIEVKLYST